MLSMQTLSADVTDPVLPVTPLVPRSPNDSKVRVMGAALVIALAPAVTAQLLVILISPLKETVSSGAVMLSIVPPLSLVASVKLFPATFGVIVKVTLLLPSEFCCAVRAREII